MEAHRGLAPQKTSAGRVDHLSYEIIWGSIEDFEQDIGAQVFQFDEVVHREIYLFLEVNLLPDYDRCSFLAQENKKDDLEFNGRIAQLVERLSYTQVVIGSSPVAPIKVSHVFMLSETKQNRRERSSRSERARHS